MAIQVETADGKRHEFPDGTAPEVIDAAIKAYVSETAPPAETTDDPVMRLDEAFQSIPGAPTLSEFAAAANRPVFEMLDFLGPDTVNAIFQVSGSDYRVPTLMETVGSEGGFMEPGLARDVVRAGGETAPVALGFGQLLRSLASRLPAMAAGESVARGVTRQMASSTAGQDVVTGLAAGAGAELGEAAGESIGGETGGQVGRMAGAVVAPIALNMATATANEANKMLRQASPGLDALRQRSDSIYQQIDDLGTTFKRSSLTKLADDIEGTLRKEGVDDDLTPLTSQWLNRFRADVQKPTLSATEVDTLRKLARVAANDVDQVGKPTFDAKLGAIAINKLDDFLGDPKGAIQGGKNVGPLFKQARELVSSRKKGELIQEAFQKAELQASGFENGLRVQFRSILNSPRKRRGFTEEELSLMRKVVEGGKLENAARVLGKFGLSLDLSGGGFLAGVTGLGGLIAGGGLGAVGAGAFIGFASGAKQAARAMTRRNADLAASVVRAGASGRKIVSAYLKNVPKAERSVEDLAGLLLDRRIPIQQLDSLAGHRLPIVSNAAYAASVLNQIPESADDEDTEQSNGDQGE